MYFVGKDIIEVRKDDLLYLFFYYKIINDIKVTI